MIIAKFPDGISEITVNGLHQWDYGQQLQIEAADLPALIEVHFACARMKEAIARSCTVTLGVATVPIPDECLEQSAPITAWVYEIDGASGTTVKTIILKVIARARPKPAGEVPQEIIDKYAEMVTAMNEQVETLRDGDVKVAAAVSADKAEQAYKDINGIYLHLSYMRIEGTQVTSGHPGTAFELKAPIGRGRVYAVRWKIPEYEGANEQISPAVVYNLGLLYWDGKSDTELHFKSNFDAYITIYIQFDYTDDVYDIASVRGYAYIDGIRIPADSTIEFLALT